MILQAIRHSIIQVPMHVAVGCRLLWSLKRSVFWTTTWSSHAVMIWSPKLRHGETTVLLTVRHRFAL